MSYNNSNSPVLRRGLRYLGPDNDKFVLIFIHDLQSWTPSRLWEFLSKKVSNCNNIIHGIVKKHSVNMENYFVIRVNYTKPTYYLNILYIITSILPVKKINWIITDRIRTFSKINRICSAYHSSPIFELSSDFLHTNPFSNVKFFNICTSWNINGWNSDKRDGLTYFNSIFKPLCICLQEVGKSNFLSSYSAQYPFLSQYKTLLRRADLDIPGMRGLYIGVHTSCSSTPDPFEYKYIISTNLLSLWGVKCSVGNIYIPTKKHEEPRNNAISDLSKWLKNHLNNPSFIVGDFNMRKDVLKNIVSTTSNKWSVMDLDGNQITYFNGGRSSCIDHIIINEEMKNYLNRASVCNTFNDISDHYPVILSCLNTSIDGFSILPTSKKVKWSNRICRIKKDDIFSHNYFSVLAEEFEHNDELKSIDMVNKLLDTANKVGNAIQAIVPTDLKGSAFHCPAFIKKLSHEKHIAYHNIKKFSLDPNLTNIEEFIQLNRRYAELCDYLKIIKKNIREIHFRNSLQTACDYFLNNDPKRAWSELKKLSKPSYSSKESVAIKDKNGKVLISKNDQLKRFAEHYKDLASDATSHSLDEEYWKKTLGSHNSSVTWDINHPITLSEIESTVTEMKNNKAPGPDGIPTEFFKAFFKSENPTDNQTESNSPDSNYSDCAKCLLLLFNKIWNGDFPSEWNSASIVSIPKKGDLSDCNNYRGISLINVGLKILSKIVTKRISDYALSHGFIRPEQFGFRNKEECISLYISIREICQRRKIKGKFTYLAFLDLKKAYDSVPIYNILTKLFNIGIRDKCLQFIKNLYLTSKARASHFGCLSDEFPIHRGVRQGCPLSPILFNIFINDVLDKCRRYGVVVEGKKCCGGLFADDIVLIAPGKSSLRNILNKVHEWALTNEMTFGINKCATLVVKPLKFTNHNNYVDPTFYLGINPIPKTNQYTYLGIPFNESLSLKPITSNLNSKLNYTLNSYFRFLTNRFVPFYLKRLVLIYYILSTVVYYAPLLGSNKSNTKKAQTILNRGMYWCFGFKSRNSNISLYSISKELNMAPLSGVCAIAQIRCFKKWKDSSCIIAHLINNIPVLSHYSWAKKSKRLFNKNINKSKKEIRNLYWENDFFKLLHCIRAEKYKKYKFGFRKEIHTLSSKYSTFSLGFFWISRIKCGFKFDVKTLIKSNIVSPDCPSCCPCCGNGIPSFTHWVLLCPKLNEIRSQCISFVDDLFINLSIIVRQKSLNVSTDSEKDFEDNINFYVLCILLGGNTIFEILDLNSEERRRFINDIFHESESSFLYPYFVGLAEFLTNVMPVVSRSFYSMINLYSIGPTVVKSVDVEPIRHRSNSDTETNDSTPIGPIFEEWEELQDIASSALSEL